MPITIAESLKPAKNPSHPNHTTPAMRPAHLLAPLLGASSMAQEQSTGHVLTGDGVKISYAQSGPPDGRQILFIPGWHQAAAEWRKQVEHFSGAGFRVTTYDMRGHGESEKPDSGYRISRFAADLNDLLGELELTDVTIVGHSMGCSIAWAWWDQYPAAHDTVGSLVMADQSAVMVRNPSWTDEEAAGLAANFAPGEIYDITNDMAAQTPALLKSMFTDSVPEADYEWIVEQNAKMSDDNAAALLLDHAFRDWRDVLPRITVPSLVLAGNASIFPHAGVEWAAEQIPGAEQYTFSTEEKGSHFAFWENPERFNAVVEEFLGKQV
ncbi:alpha/beta hydrolase [Candidatus Bathyarchaeota archaeon]|nr:alpha/beta hydrolase [Candidatus Bathyarchaeota archaeon]